MKYFLGLGSNLGTREKNIFTAIELLGRNNKIKLLEISKIIETEPWGKKEQPDFLNCVIVIETKLKPYNLLIECQKIEEKIGRKREIKWEPRKIDIDILFCEDKIINSKDLIIPHPYIHKREFVLTSLVELFPEFVHPVQKKTVKVLFEELKSCR